MPSQTNHSCFEQGERTTTLSEQAAVLLRDPGMIHLAFIARPNSKLLRDPGMIYLAFIARPNSKFRVEGSGAPKVAHQGLTWTPQN
eukprot:7807742-Pyramimonas_sp.AAC.1